MPRLFESVEALLRARTAPSAGRPGRAPTILELLQVALLLGASYGLCMGLFGTLRGTSYGLWHLLAVAVKVPALFLLTLAVTAPSLYVFSALARSELGFRRTLHLLLTATALSIAVLASFGPVTAFFTFSTKSHPFVQLLNVALFAIAGLVGLRFLWRSLTGLLVEAAEGEPPEAEDRPEGARGQHALAPSPEAVERRRRASGTGELVVWRVLVVWFVIYGLVGAQMGWLLRPFLGDPNLPNQLFRATEGNIFEGVLDALRYL